MPTLVDSKATYFELCSETACNLKLLIWVN